jgi:hypothetical protein
MRAGAPAQEATMNSQKLTHEVDFICPHCEAQYVASYTRRSNQKPYSIEYSVGPGMGVTPATQ